MRHASHTKPPEMRWINHVNNFLSSAPPPEKPLVRNKHSKQIKIHDEEASSDYSIEEIKYPLLFFCRSWRKKRKSECYVPRRTRKENEITFLPREQEIRKSYANKSTLSLVAPNEIKQEEDRNDKHPALSGHSFFPFSHPPHHHTLEPVCMWKKRNFIQRFFFLSRTPFAETERRKINNASGSDKVGEKVLEAMPTSVAEN